MCGDQRERASDRNLSGCTKGTTDEWRTKALGMIFTGYSWNLTGVTEGVSTGRPDAHRATYVCTWLDTVN